MSPAKTHLVLLPSYNSGPRLASVVAEVLRHWQPVLVVIDGSTDGSDGSLRDLAAREPGLSVISLARNSGKGAAVLAGLNVADERGFSHALVMDADGQHPASQIREFMEMSRSNPDAMILGRPIFGPEVPLERLYFRRISIGLVHLATLGSDISDPLYGFRVYPVQRLRELLGPRRYGRRYDFDAEAAVRLFWSGVRALNVPSPVRYFNAAEGGITHFRYFRDNLTLARMHFTQLGELLFRQWPSILRNRRRWRAADAQTHASIALGSDSTENANVR